MIFNYFKNIGLAVFTCLSCAHANAGWITTDLGTFGGQYGDASGLNNKGQVVGYASTLGDETIYAFISTGSTIKSVGTLGGVYSQGSGINDQGQIIGLSKIDPSSPRGSQHIFRGDTDGLTDLGRIGDSVQDPHLINNVGQVVGSYLLGGEIRYYITSVEGLKDMVGGRSHRR